MSINMSKKSRGIIVITSCCVLLLGGYFTIRYFLAHDEFLGPAENFITKTDAPLTLEQARNKINFSFPDEASDIYYAHYSQWIAYEFFVRFNASAEVCKSRALLLIEQYNSNENNTQRHIPLEFKQITKPPAKEVIDHPLNIIWFDVHNIKNGFTIGGNNPSQPFIWIDVDRNLFYYRLTD